jgi:hypothetical protein
VSIADLIRRDAPGRYLAQRQRKFPPIYQKTSSSWEALFGTALDVSTPKLRALAKRGAIASGEVGELTPSTHVTRKGRGYAIEMHSGQMRLIYSAARVLMASDPGQFRGDKSAALSTDEVAKHVADLFRNYDERRIATAQKFPATAGQTGWADLIAQNAECFLLLHELAHIHNGDLALWRAILGVEAKVRNQERAADATACRWLIDYIVNEKAEGAQRQMLYAGAEFGLRVRMAMETVGLKFNPTHPPSGDRVAAMREQLQKRLTPRSFYAIASTSIAFDQMWRAIELVLCNKEPVFEQTLDELVVGLRTLTIEILNVSRDVIQIKEVPNQPEMKRAVFIPVDARQLAMAEAARNAFRDVPQKLRDAVERQADDVFERGSLEFSVFLALLNSSRP